MIDFRSLAEADHVPIIRRDTEEYLEKLIRKEKINNILEFGTAIGYSAAFFDAVSEKTRVCSVEKDEYAFEIAKHNLKSLGKEGKIQFILGDALRLTDTIKEMSGGEFDLVFIDGGKSHYLQLVKEAMQLCRIGGYILSDDIWQRGLTKINPLEAKRKHRTSMRNMQEYLEYITTAPELKTELLDIGDGLAISKYIGK